MAYTFEELEKWWPGKSFPLASVKLLLTQEDGRTSYADGIINTFNSATREFAGQFAQQFNDRIRQLRYGPPSNSWGLYDQNFDKNYGVDLADFAFKKIATNQFELRLTLLRWGNAQVNVTLAKASRAKLYTGWGATIGAGSGLALYAVSINGADETPG